MTNRIKEAEEYVKDTYPEYPAGAEGSEWFRGQIKTTYLAACEKCEGERDAELRALAKLLLPLHLPKDIDRIVDKFKTHNNEHGNKG